MVEKKEENVNNMNIETLIQESNAIMIEAAVKALSVYKSGKNGIKVVQRQTVSVMIECVRTNVCLISELRINNNSYSN